ncbi:transcription factor S-II [archaeon]|nr:transcription factor S-II [archaeon]
MVIFCEKCKNLMFPKGNVLVCTTCGQEKPIENESEYKIKRKEKKRDRLLLLEEEDVHTMPRIKSECSKCGNMEAEWWLVQTRKADESETRFFRCTKCKYTWREYQ